MSGMRIQIVNEHRDILWDELGETEETIDLAIDEITDMLMNLHETHSLQLPETTEYTIRISH